MPDLESAAVGTAVGRRTSFSREGVTLRAPNEDAEGIRVTKGDLKHEYLCA